MASRILASSPHRPLRIAATYAAAGGAMLAGVAGVERMNRYVADLFDGAVVVRFTVAGEREVKGRSGRSAESPMAACEALSVVEKADLVFVGGGDPVQGARRLAQTGADAWLRDARARGTPCLGISAGAIMLGAWWAEWPDAPPATGPAPHDGGALVQCAGVVPDLVVDCHAEDDDWSELRLVRDMLRERLVGAPQPRFLGLPTDRGLIVGADGSTQHVGGAPFDLGLELLSPLPL